MILAVVAAALLSGEAAPLSSDTQTFLSAAVRERSDATPWPSIFKEEVDNIIENARDAVVKAAVAAHRYDLASDVAKVLLDDPRAWGWAGDTLPILARYGKPGIAAHEISMLEQRLVNHDPYNQLELTRLDILYKAWLALGRADQAQALLEYWKPEARAERRPIET